MEENVTELSTDIVAKTNLDPKILVAVAATALVAGAAYGVYRWRKSRTVEVIEAEDANA